MAIEGLRVAKVLCLPKCQAINGNCEVRNCVKLQAWAGDCQGPIQTLYFVMIP